jgi:hypothetical protein
MKVVNNFNLFSIDAFSLLKGGMALLEERLLYTVMNGIYLDYQ